MQKRLKPSLGNSSVHRRINLHRTETLWGVCCVLRAVRVGGAYVEVTSHGEEGGFSLDAFQRQSARVLGATQICLQEKIRENLRTWWDQGEQREFGQSCVALAFTYSLPVRNIRKIEIANIQVLLSTRTEVTLHYTRYDTLTITEPGRRGAKDRWKRAGNGLRPHNSNTSVFLQTGK